MKKKFEKQLLQDIDVCMKQRKTKAHLFRDVTVDFARLFQAIDIQSSYSNRSLFKIAGWSSCPRGHVGCGRGA